MAKGVRVRWSWGGAVGGFSSGAGGRPVALRPALEPLEGRQLLAGFPGPKMHAVAYNPTWPGWSSTAAPQLNDSDFFNASFRGLWGGEGGGRDDLATIGGAGFNLVRLYNWGPSRQAADGSLDAHYPFLNAAQARGLKVIVPVSDYFLGDDKYAWNGKNPDAQYHFQSAPEAIQTDLLQFVAGVTRNGKIHPAVHSISIGNELDLGIDNDPGATGKLRRAMWWAVNLQRVFSQKFGGQVPRPFLTIPISNADQGDAWAAETSTGSNAATTLNDTNTDAHPPWAANSFAGLTLRIVGGTGAGQERTVASNTATGITVTAPWDTVPDATSQYQVANPSPTSWFQVFEHGAKAGDRVPTGTVPDGPAGRFSGDVAGLGSHDWYSTWFYNSVNMFQRGDQLRDTLVQYDTGRPGGPSWSRRWPGEKIDVPLFVSELGTSRFNIGQSAQSEAVAVEQAQVAEDVLRTSTNLMGYTIFEFNDEPNKNNITDGPLSEQFFGINQYNTDQAHFRDGVLLSRADTGPTKWAGGVMPNYNYPIYKLIPVLASDGTTLMAKLRGLFGR